MSIHEDTIQGLQEALAYVQGDKTKGISVTITVPDEEIETINKFYELSERNKRIATVLINELDQAAGQ